LVRRPGSNRYYYKRRFPAHLIEVIGREVFHQSTGKSEQAEAKKVVGLMEARYRMAIADAEEKIISGRSGPTAPDEIVAAFPTLRFPSAPSLPQLSDEQAVALATRYLRERLLELTREGDAEPFDPEWARELDHRIAMLGDSQDDQTSRWTQEQAARLLIHHGIAAEPHRGAGLLLVSLIRRALLQLIKIRRARLTGDFSDQITDSAFRNQNVSAVALAPAAKSAGSTMLDGELIDLWAAERKVSPKGIDKHKAVVRWFYDRVGRLAVEDITVSHVIDFKNSMVRDGVTAANANTKLSCLRTLLQYAKLNHKRLDNPATGISILDKDAPRRRRKEWDVQHLHRLFASPVYASDDRPKRGRGEAAYWMPLIALFSGARLEEIAQLRLADFRQETYYGDADEECSAWVMDITHEEPQAEGESDLGTSTKTAAGTRRVPIHPELLRLGLIRYVQDLRQAGDAKLFPKLTQNKYGKVGAKWGEWWTTYRRDVCGIITDGVVFHSFRHTFKYFARHVSIEDALQREIMGHSPGDTADEYAPSGHGLHRLVEAMRSYRIPGLKLPAPPPAYR
jgi:integrase